MVSKCCSAIESAEKNAERDRGQRRKIRIAARDNGTLRHQFFRVIDHLPGEILDRECLTSVVDVLITEQLHVVACPQGVQTSGGTELVPTASFPCSETTVILTLPFWI